MNFLLTLSLATLLAAPINEPAPFAVGVTLLTQSGRLRVAINKSDQQRLSVRITQTNGVTLLEDFVGRYELTYRRVFNLQELPTGSYCLLISDGKQTIRRTLTIERVEPVVVPLTRLVSLQD